MKKVIVAAICWPLFQFYNPSFAQKEKIKDKDNNSREIIIMRNGDKDSKITIETKNGETFINGKPASEYKDDNIKILPGRGRNNFIYAPDGNITIFNNEKKAFLGVTTEKADNGAKINTVEKNSPADKAGLKEGDVITKVGDKTVSDPEDLINAVTSHKPKDDVRIAFSRNGKSDDVKTTLGERNAFAYSFNMPDMKLQENLLRNQENLLRNYNRQFNFTMPKIQTMPNMVWRFGGGRHLGVKIEDAENDGGARVTNVEEGSAAEKSGLKKDDIITEVNGKKVKDVNEVVQQIRDASDKDAYTIRAKRNGSEMNFDVKIPKKKSSADL